MALLQGTAGLTDLVLYAGALIVGALGLAAGIASRVAGRRRSRAVSTA